MAAFQGCLQPAVRVSTGPPRSSHLLSSWLVVPAGRWGASCHPLHRREPAGGWGAAHPLDRRLLRSSNPAGRWGADCHPLDRREQACRWVAVHYPLDRWALLVHSAAPSSAATRPHLSQVQRSSRAGAAKSTAKHISEHLRPWICPRQAAGVSQGCNPCRRRPLPLGRQGQSILKRRTARLSLRRALSPRKKVRLLKNGRKTKNLQKHF